MFIAISVRPSDNAASENQIASSHVRAPSRCHSLIRRGTTKIRSLAKARFDLNGGVTAFLASEWAPVVQTAIGAVVAIAGGGFVQSFTQQQERRSVAAAFAGELKLHYRTIGQPASNPSTGEVKNAVLLIHSKAALFEWTPLEF
jgi:hypothetical protein